MKTYSKYNDSGIDWIGEIPEHWTSVSLKWISIIYSGGTPSKNKPEYWSEGTIPWLNSGTVNQGDITEASEYITEEALSNSSAKWIPEKAILIALAGQGKTKGMVAQTQFKATCNQSLGIIVPNLPELNRFLLYWLRKNYQNIRNLGGGDKRDGINLEMIGSIPIPLPTKTEQTAIADYLDIKTSDLEQLIEEKKQLVKLYHEEKTAIINQAVTKGINPNAKLKDSGIGWLGDIPEHWEVKKLKYVAKMQGGFAFSSKEFTSEGIQLLKIANLYNNDLHLERQPTFLPDTFALSHKDWLITSGDILMSMTGTLGKRDYGFAILIAKAKGMFLLNQRVSKIHSINGIKLELILNILHSEYFLNSLFSKPAGTKQGNFSNEDILNLEIAFPKEDTEQRSIVEFIDSESQRIDAKIKKAKKYIKLLTEYHTALISEVVTGKIKVID
jgi:type I restriction enzyme S subunit